MSQSNYLQHEAVDRINMVSEIIHSHLLEQPMIKHTKELQVTIEQAAQLLYEAYQSASLMDDVTDEVIFNKLDLK